MNCFYCKGSLENSVTNHVVNLENRRIIIVRDVPCEKCSQCGESYYDDDVMSRLEIIVNNLRAALTEVAIIDYADKPA
ncbi:MAG: type II toxin-antitoxin system MqsA family antitoxin [Oscillospiraceae bacterium]|nr:type II toxin-antitoxin system MqsA family antitoxin [Oscillospiraceae bacterium]